MTRQVEAKHSVEARLQPLLDVLINADDNDVYCLKTKWTSLARLSCKQRPINIAFPFGVTAWWWFRRTGQIISNIIWVSPFDIETICESNIHWWQRMEMRHSHKHYLALICREFCGNKSVWPWGSWPRFSVAGWTSRNAPAYIRIS